jgi:hypothetical protein
MKPAPPVTRNKDSFENDKCLYAICFLSLMVYLIILFKTMTPTSETAISEMAISMQSYIILFDSPNLSAIMIGLCTPLGTWQVKLS